MACISPLRARWSDRGWCYRVRARSQDQGAEVVTVGSQLGSYLLRQLLGAGGMGRVYLAEHVHMKTMRAVKVLSQELSQRQDVVARFVNEASAASKVLHR